MIGAAIALAALFLVGAAVGFGFWVGRQAREDDPWWHDYAAPPEEDVDREEYDSLGAWDERREDGRAR